MKDIFKRDPRGRFIWKGQALRSWLPVLMNACYGGYVVDTVLAVVAAYCDRKAAEQLEAAARACRRHPNDRAFKPSGYVASAESWLHKAAVIRKANEDCQEIPF